MYIYLDDVLQATVLCDFVTMYILKKGYFYRDNKYFYVQDADSLRVSSRIYPFFNLYWYMYR